MCVSGTAKSSPTVGENLPQELFGAKMQKLVNNLPFKAWDQSISKTDIKSFRQKITALRSVDAAPDLLLYLFEHVCQKSFNSHRDPSWVKAWTIKCRSITSVHSAIVVLSQLGEVLDWDQIGAWKKSENGTSKKGDASMESGDGPSIELPLSLHAVIKNKNLGEPRTGKFPQGG